MTTEKRFALLLLAVVSSTGFFLACSKKESPAPQSSPPMQMMPGGMSQGTTGNMPGGMQGGMPAAPPHGNISMPPAESMQITVPASVKGKWKAVILTVVDRETSNVKEYSAPIGGKLTLPKINLVVEVREFLPDFKIDGTQYTSASNNPLNPAAQVVVTEGGKQIFMGWLFQKFPSMHPFTHQRLGITLKAGVPS